MTRALEAIGVALGCASVALSLVLIGAFVVYELKYALRERQTRRRNARVHDVDLTGAGRS